MRLGNYMDGNLPFAFKVPETELGSTNKELFETVKKNREEDGGIFVEGVQKIPASTEITLEELQKLGFEVKFFLKEPTTSGEDFNNGAVVSTIIQHKNKSEVGAVLLTDRIEDKSSIEIAAGGLLAIRAMVPDAFPVDFDLEKFADSATKGIDAVLKREKEDEEIRNAKIKYYHENKGAAEKATKKALDNIRHKTKMLKQAQAEKAPEAGIIQMDILRKMGEVAGIRDCKSFDDLLAVPEIKAEVDKGTDLGGIFEVMAKLQEDGNNVLNEDKNLQTKLPTKEQVEAEQADLDQRRAAVKSIDA